MVSCKCSLQLNQFWDVNTWLLLSSIGNPLSGAKPRWAWANTIHNRWTVLTVLASLSGRAKMSPVAMNWLRLLLGGMLQEYSTIILDLKLSLEILCFSCLVASSEFFFQRWSRPRSRPRWITHRGPPPGSSPSRNLWTRTV